MTPIMYSKENCPLCDVLREKLDAAGIEYKEVKDINELKAVGVDRTPVLNVDGRFLHLTDANKWIKDRSQHEYPD